MNSGTEKNQMGIVYRIKSHETADDEYTIEVGDEVGKLAIFNTRCCQESVANVLSFSPCTR